MILQPLAHQNSLNAWCIVSICNLSACCIDETVKGQCMARAPAELFKESERKVPRAATRRRAARTASVSVKILKDFCKQRWWQEALATLNSLDRYASSVVSEQLMNWVFVACAKGQAWEHAIRLLSHLHRDQVSTDVSYTMAIKACNSALHREVGILLVADLLTDSVTPNAARHQ